MKCKMLTKSLAFTEAPLSQRSFTLEEQPAMTVEKNIEKNAIISDHLSLMCINQLTQQSGPAVLKRWKSKNAVSLKAIVFIVITLELFVQHVWRGRY